MSLTFNPYGLSYVDLKGGKDKMSTSTYTIQSNYGYSIGQGDPVMVGVNGNIQVYFPPTTPTPPALLIAEYNMVGVAVSFEWYSVTGVHMKNQPYWPANTPTLNNVPAIVRVEDPTDNVYKIQVGPGGLSLTSPSTACFKNYSMSDCRSASIPNARTSQSTAYINPNTYVAGPSGNYWLSLKILGLAPDSLTSGPNSWYDPYPEVLVMVNSHMLKTGTNGL